RTRRAREETPQAKLSRDLAVVEAPLDRLPLRMKSRSAFPVGVVGGAAMSAVMFLARLLGLQANLGMMLGTLFLPPGAVAWGVGFVVHLVVSGLIGLLYGRGFERVTHRASAGAG